MTEFYRVREPFAFTGKNGVPRTLSAGALLSADDPDLTESRKKFCELVPKYVDRVNAQFTETTSAAPGEYRSVQHPLRARRGPKPAADKPPVPAPSKGDAS